MVHRIGWQSDQMTIRSSVLYTDNTPCKVIEKFMRESKIHKALTDRTIVYESHVRKFWSSVRYVENEKMMRMLGDSDDDPTIIPERLCKGLWCRMGFTGHLKGKYLKTIFSTPYKFLIHCVVHDLSHRKGAYDETSDYIMNIITCLVLNRPYNVSQVIFNYMVDNVGSGSGKYIMYPRFIQMMIDDQFKDLPKDHADILGLRNMTTDNLSRLAKNPKKDDSEPRARRIIFKIDNPAYVAPENDAWRHDNSNSENEDDKMREMVEKKLRYWFVKDGKRKRTPKISPSVSIP
ncbi:hypothetical protein Hanom_Chr15g01386081 [Helianthus anomalus]